MINNIFVALQLDGDSLRAFQDHVRRELNYIERIREMPLLPRDLSNLNGIRLPAMRRNSLPTMSTSTRPYEALYQNTMSRTGRSRATRPMGNNSTTYGAVVQRSQSSDSPSSAGSLPPIAAPKTNKQVENRIHLA